LPEQVRLRPFGRRTGRNGGVPEGPQLAALAARARESWSVMKKEYEGDWRIEKVGGRILYRDDL